jgi:acetyl-CoA decarbonylase/synthase, CODH/ACS complex subunit delta
MAVETPIEKWTGKVRELTLGATLAEGGTRAKSVTVGGETTLPFLHFEGEVPHAPALALDVWDVAPTDWSPILVNAWGDLLNDPIAWAKKGAELGADLIVLRLKGTSPDAENRGGAQTAELVKELLAAVDRPLIVYGTSSPEKDNEVLLAAAEAGAGERMALGPCEDKNYRSIVAGCLAHGHHAIAFSPMDVNLAKQLNILVTEMGLPAERILIDPTTGALGYGVEYCVSVMERIRLAALQGDSMTQMPMICSVGEEAWRTKEAKTSQGVPDAWGDFASLGVNWEIVTATALINAGADIVALRHPETLAAVRKMVDKLMRRES